jgi:hypothetical protein
VAAAEVRLNRHQLAARLLPLRSARVQTEVILTAVSHDPLYPGMDQHTAIEFFMATTDGTAIDGWHWLIEWTTTSFYIKSMNPAAQLMKVSMHGPDPRPQHRGKEHFRFDVERTNQDRADRAVETGGRWLTDTGELPFYFEGYKINDHARLIVRFSAGHDAFMPGAPAAGGSDWPLENAMKGLVPVPTEGSVVHVDLFLSDNGEPYWPNEEAVRAARAGLGFIKNSLGWCLSAVIYSRDFDAKPDPCGDYRGETPVDRCARGIAAAVDETGVLWLCENLIPQPRESPQPSSE